MTKLVTEPSFDGISRLSPYLHFGFLSIQEIVYAVENANAPDARQGSIS